jgi:hypothetical protein
VATKTIEKRVSDLDEIIDDVPRLLNIRFSYVRAQLDALDARIGTVEAKVDRLEARIGGVEAKIDALPRVLAEMLDERDRRRS